MRQLAIVALAASWPVCAPSYAGLSGPTGAGEAPCSEYLAAAKAPAHEDIYAQWASGMIAGIVSQTSRVPIADLTLEKIASALRKYCTSNPKETLIEATGKIAMPYLVARPYSAGREMRESSGGT